MKAISRRDWGAAGKSSEKAPQLQTLYFSKQKWWARQGTVLQKGNGSLFRPLSEYKNDQKFLNSYLQKLHQTTLDGGSLFSHFRVQIGAALAKAAAARFLQDSVYDGLPIRVLYEHKSASQAPEIPDQPLYHMPSEKLLCLCVFSCMCFSYVCFSCLSANT